MDWKRMPSVETVKSGSGMMVNSDRSSPVKQMPRMMTSIEVHTTNRYLIWGLKMSGIGFTNATETIDSKL